MEDIKSKIFATFMSIKSSIMGIIEPMLNEENLSKSEFFTLFGIYGRESVCVGNMSEEFGIKPANASAMCKQLEKKGYLIRERSKEDERRVNLKITEKTEVFFKKMKSHEYLADEVLKKYDEEKLEIMLKGLTYWDELAGELKNTKIEEKKLNA